MKKLKNIILLLIPFYFFIQLNTYTIAQPTYEDQGFCKLVVQVDPPYNIDPNCYDRDEPDLIFWDYFDLVVGLSLNHFNAWGLPTEISANYIQVDNQTTDCITDWNNNMYIDEFNTFHMGYNLQSYSADLQFSDDPQYFSIPQSTLGTTLLAVIYDDYDDSYKFTFYSPLI